MEYMSNGLRRHAPSTLRNREPILAVLKRQLPAAGLILEVASGSGEHASFIAPRLPLGLEWQPTEASLDALADIDACSVETDCSRIRPAVVLNACDTDWSIQSADAVFCEENGGDPAEWFLVAFQPVKHILVDVFVPAG